MITRIMIPAALAVLLLVASGTAEAGQATVTLDAHRIDGALGEILQELARLEGVSENASQSACRRMHSDIATLRRRVAQLQGEIREVSGASFSVSVEVNEGRRGRGGRHGAGVEVALPPPPPPPPEVVVVIPEPVVEPVAQAPVPTSERDFARLVARIEDEAFSAGKLRVLDDAADYAWLTSSQVVRILGLFSFSSDQLKALDLIVRNIIDPENAFEIYGAFTFDSDKEKARQIMRSARQ